MTWEGWVTDLTLVAFFFAAGPWFRSTQRAFLALGLLFGTLFLRAVIAHWKGEPDGWR